MPDYGTQVLKKLLDDVQQMSLEDYEKLYFAAQEREDISVILDLSTNSTTFNYQKQLLTKK
ncbi:hypothetical protein IT568_07135 [bacterium]|nr:hypothetical protein [bacterium]